jgi:O-antigen/teichoic acid export membrane protein
MAPIRRGSIGSGEENRMPDDLPTALDPEVSHSRLRIRALSRASCGGFVLKGLALMATLASQLVLAHAMPLAAFGSYVTAVAWLTILSLFGGLGLPLAAIRFLPRYWTGRQWPLFRGFLRQSLWWSFASTALIASGFLAFVLTRSTWRADFTEALAAAMLVPLLCLTALGVAVLQALKLPLRAEATANLGRPLLVIALIGGAAWLGGPLDPWFALALTSAANLLVLAATAGLVWRALPVGLTGDHSAAERSEWMASGVSLLLSLAAMALIERIDTILVSALVGPTDAGIYSVASRVAMILGLGFAAVNALLGPMSAELLGGDSRAALQRILSHGVLLMTGLAGAAAAGLLVLAPFLLRLFGRDFTDAQGPLAVLLAGQFALGLCGPAGGTLAVAGKNRILVSVMTAAMILDVVLCLLTIPAFGKMGAAFSTAIALAASGIGLAVVARRNLQVDTTVRAGLMQLLSDARGLAPLERRAP